MRSMKRGTDISRSVRFLLCVVSFLLLTPRIAFTENAEMYKEKGLGFYYSRDPAPGSLDRAIEMFEKALRLEPDDYEALWRLAQFYQIAGQMRKEKAEKIAKWKQGVGYGKRAVDVNPKGKEGHFYYMTNLGALAKTEGLLSSVRKFRRIKREMDKSLELDPDYAPALVARGQYLTRMPGIFGGDEQEAYRLYERALRVDPGYRIAYFYLAELDLKNKRYEEAIAHLNKIIHWPEEDRTGQWYRHDLPSSEKLLREVLRRQAEGK